MTQEEDTGGIALPKDIMFRCQATLCSCKNGRTHLLNLLPSTIIEDGKRRDLCFEAYQRYTNIGITKTQFRHGVRYARSAEKCGIAFEDLKSEVKGE